MLIEKIGTTAMLEQTAEEAVELALACLKYARFLRGENKVYGYSEEELKEKLTEEMADVNICIWELIGGNAIALINYGKVRGYKKERMRKRLAEETLERVCNDDEIAKDIKRHILLDNFKKDANGILKNLPKETDDNYDEELDSIIRKHAKEFTETLERKIKCSDLEDLKEMLNERYGPKMVVKGNCIFCGKELGNDDGFLFCKDCEGKL